MLKAGVDEAGRGPCLGPLVICGVTIDEKDEAKLKALGVKDSKLLSKEEREELYPKIMKIVKDYKFIKIFPEEIDARDSKYLSLNDLEAVKAAEIINYLKPEKVIVDCPSPNIPAFKNYLLRLIDNKKIDLIPEHKADFNHVVVGAASVIAKVERDNEIEKIKKELGVEFGSGYPSDPVTKKFLSENWEKYPGLFRKTWETWKVFKEKKNQKGLFDF